MEQPLKVMTPAASCCVQPARAPGPPFAANVTVEESEVTVLPPASSTVTTGSVAKPAPPVAVGDGWVVNARWLATPVPTLKELLVALRASPASVAVRVYAPAVSMVQPVKLATPAVVVSEQPERAPAPVLIARMMGCVSKATVLPPASSIATTGCATKALPPVAPPGSFRKARRVAGPVLTVNGALAASASFPSDAMSL